VRLGLIAAGLLTLSGCGEGCSRVDHVPVVADQIRPTLRVLPDRVLSRGPGFEAELTLPTLKGLEDERLARGVSAWLQRAPRKAMAAWREQATRAASRTEPWTMTSTYEVTHDGARWLSIVQDIHSSADGVEETVRLAVTLDRQTLKTADLSAVLGPEGGPAPPAAQGGFYLTDDAVIGLDAQGRVAWRVDR